MFFWVVVLQGVMLWSINSSYWFICNGGGAWPFSELPLLGGTFLTLFVTALILFWAWKALAREDTEKGIPYRAFLWALLGAAGLSHTLERASSQCIVDYWPLPFFGSPFYFNLGDLSLTFGTLFLIGLWLWEGKTR